MVDMLNALTILLHDKQDNCRFRSRDRDDVIHLIYCSACRWTDVNDDEVNDDDDVEVGVVDVRQFARYRMPRIRDRDWSQLLFSIRGENGWQYRS